MQGFACAACVASAAGESEYSDWRDFVVAAQGASCFVDVGDIVGMRACAAPVGRLVIVVVAAVAAVGSYSAAEVLQTRL